MSSEAIGKVTATEKSPSTCNNLKFWVHKDVLIRPFDIVKIEHLAKGGTSNCSQTYALVKELRYITDSAGDLANYVSSDFGDLEASPQYERLGATIADAEVLYNDAEIEMPVRDGAIVKWADNEGIKDALGLRGFSSPIPAGYICMSNGQEIPIELEADYLLGPEGAHLNIAGISGLATKTSYAMFLLNSIQQKLADKVTMIVFNVKGSDLLCINEPNTEISEGDKEEWEKCSLSAVPFTNVKFLYPYGNKGPHYTQSHIDTEILEKQKRDNIASSYIYDIETGKGKLPLLYSDIDDPNSTLESIAHQIVDLDAASWEQFREEAGKKSSKGSNKGENISVMSWRKFNRLLAVRTDNDIFCEKAVTQRDKKRQTLICDAISGLKPGDILVIDVEPLPDYLQCLVFGDVLQTIYSIKLGDFEDTSPADLGTVVIFADELNKYAPKASDSNRTLTRNLLEVTERGRSLGVVLFGAEQFRSGVHERILGNCSTNVYGRTSPVEISKGADYRYFPESFRYAITRLPKGNLLLQHAIFKTSLIKVRFPRPIYYQPKGGK